jgi:HK97 family phage major capsid protein
MSNVELREQRMRLATQAREILTGAASEKRALTGEENAKFDAIHADIDAMAATIEKVEKQDVAERKLGESISKITESMKPKAGDQPTLRSIALGDYDPTREWEARAVAKSNVAGGLDVQVADAFEEALKYFGPMWEVASVIRTETGNSLNLPTVNDTGNPGAILSEAGTVLTADPTFSSVVLGAYKYSSKAVLVSVELLQDSIIPLEGMISRQLAERIARASNADFTTKTDGPFGITTTQCGATVGATASATNALVYGDFVSLIHSVDPWYRRSGKFMMSDTIIMAARKLVDSQNRPLWEPNVQAGQPDTFLGYPIFNNTSMTTAITTGQKVAIFGDLSKYTIRVAGGLTIVVARELYAANHQVGYFGFLRCDGNLLDAGTKPVKWLAMA